MRKKAGLLVQYLSSRFLRQYYHLNVRALYYLCGLTGVQSFTRRQKRQAASVDLFLRENDIPQEFWRDIKRNAVMTHLVNRLWGVQLNNVAPVIVEGREYVERAQAAKKGVIFARFHQEMGKYSSPLSVWLDQQDFRPQVTVGGAHDVRAEQMKISEKFVFAQDLFEAQKILRKGGVIQIVPDGAYGSQGHEVELLQHPLILQTGFAELANSTQALVIPIRLQYEVNGMIVIKISPPLPTPPNELASDQKIAFLLEGYLEVMAEFWKTSPHMITPGHMRKQLGTPKKPRRKSH